MVEVIDASDGALGTRWTAKCRPLNLLIIFRSASCRPNAITSLVLFLPSPCGLRAFYHPMRIRVATVFETEAVEGTRHSMNPSGSSKSAPCDCFWLNHGSDWRSSLYSAAYGRKVTQSLFIILRFSKRCNQQRLAICTTCYLSFCSITRWYQIDHRSSTSLPDSNI